MQFIQENLLALVIALLVVLVGSGVVIAVWQQKNKSRNELPASTQKRAQLEAQEIADAQIIEDVPLADEPGAEQGGAAQDTTALQSIAAQYEVPESVPSRMQRLRARLAKGGGLGQSILAILSRTELSAQDWEEIEETLLMADVGMDATTEILENLQREVKVKGSADAATVKQLLHAELLRAVQVDASRELDLAPRDLVDGQKLPAPILMVGVNGTGKTTTTGKLARLLVAEEKQIVLGAADTFRAAAADQLQTWGERVGVQVVRANREGADPASVAFEAVKTACDVQADVVIVDTAGRLQNKAGLMDELGKIKRVMEKQVPVREVLLVLDATTGQNGLQQAKIFAEVANITGIVLSKLDGTAKGGIVISVQRTLGVPVKFIGLGEGADDLAPFDPENFVDSLLA
ncbi:signal recognition particle-docking protein FtsY [Arcanobacterium hippocoleae]